MGASFGFATITDNREHGVLDEIHFALKGRPIREIPGRASQWELTDNPDEDVFVSTYPARRTYTQESNFVPAEAPWQEEFQEYNEAQRQSE